MVAGSDVACGVHAPARYDSGGGARSGEVVPMAAGPGPESRGGSTSDGRVLEGGRLDAALRRRVGYALLCGKRP
jgi:hypothetical protein